MPDKAVISHRGEKYEIGRGKRFYGIWVVGAPYEAPVDRWPENRDGWQQAWARFAAIEVPGTITPVARERKGLPLKLGRARRRRAAAPRPADAEARRRVCAPGGGRGRRRRSGEPGRRRRAALAAGATAVLAGEALLVLGVVLGLAGLFPAYVGGKSLLSQWDQVVPHLCYVIGWALTAALVALSVVRPSNAARLGALFGLGLSAVTFGLFLADIGEVTAGVLARHRPGREPARLARLHGGRGARARRQRRAVRACRRGRQRPGRGHAGPLALLVLAAIGTAAAFAPSWDRYVLTFASRGHRADGHRGQRVRQPGRGDRGQRPGHGGGRRRGRPGGAVAPGPAGGAAARRRARAARRGGGLRPHPGRPAGDAGDVRHLGRASRRVRADDLIRANRNLLGLLCVRDFPARIVRVALHRARSSGNAGNPGIAVDAGRGRCRDARRRRYGRERRCG